MILLIFKTTISDRTRVRKVLSDWDLYGSADIRMSRLNRLRFLYTNQDRQDGSEPLP